MHRTSEVLPPAQSPAVVINNFYIPPPPEEQSVNYYADSTVPPILASANASNEKGEGDEEDEFINELNELEKNLEVRKGLRKWAIEHKITHSALREVMALFNRFGNIFPGEPRSFLDTPQTIIKTKCLNGGEYWHNSLEETMKNLFQNLYEPKTISLNINMNGLPIFNSSKTEFWPILFNVYEMPNLPPVPIGIFCGVGKCDLGAFLTPFVDEMKEIMANGIIINSNKFPSSYL